MKHYMLENKDGAFNLYSPRIGLYMMEGVTLDEIKIALAEEIEYKAKLEIVKLLMTFPHDFMTTDGEIIAYDEAVKEFEVWHSEVHQQLVFPEKYNVLIDEKIRELLT